LVFLDLGTQLHFVHFRPWLEGPDTRIRGMIWDVFPFPGLIFHGRSLLDLKSQ
jgi:hypothetical protein